MSDLDNSNLTNEEENSGFSPSDSDNKSFSADKENPTIPTGNKDWGQTNYFSKPKRKMPLWPFLLVGAFVLVGLWAFFTVSSNVSSLHEREMLAKNGPHIMINNNNHTKHIAINKRFVVETKKSNIHPTGHHSPESMNKCNPDSKCGPKDCKPGGKCDPEDCKPGGKCEPKDCKHDAKYDPKSGKPIHRKSQCQKPTLRNSEEIEIKTVTPKPLRKRIYPKEGKPRLLDNATGLYVLQVYAALSKEDADAKYEEYKSKGVEKVWVSTFSKANVIWYRVRIGDFTTISAADAKAKELGISTYWVDKIR